jgi:hypothetical protein
VVWLGRSIVPFGRSYFDTPVLDGATSYRVAIHAVAWSRTN